MLEQSSSITHSRIGTQIPRIIIIFELWTFESIEVKFPPLEISFIPVIFPVKPS